jgi:membrane associated rhomboid family serine protease/tetratricopeptide (TPR) repeat protein
MARRRGPAIGTFALVAAGLLVHLLAPAGDGGGDALALLAWGAKANEPLFAGELWRFVTPVFLHVSRWHLACNLLFLWLFGPLLEVLIGTGRFLALYVIAGACGVVVGFGFHDEQSVGSSGAVFGVLGGLLSFVLVNRGALRHLTTRHVIAFGASVGAFLLVGLTQPRIDNFAHAGGLAGGLLAGLVLAPRLPGLSPRPLLRICGGAALATLVALCLARGWAWMQVLEEGKLAHARGDIDGARSAFRTALGMRSRPLPALMALARIEVRQGNMSEADRLITRAVGLDPENADLRDHVADLLRELGRPADELAAREKARALAPDEWAYAGRLGRAYLEAGEARKAATALGFAFEKAGDDEPELEYHLGDALRRTGQIARGNRHLAQYEARLRDGLRRRFTPTGANNLAWFLLEEGRSLDEARRLAVQAVGAQPANPYFLGTLGCIQYRMGRLQDGLMHLERALSHHDSRAAAATDLCFAAMATAQLRQPAAARKYLELAAAAAPANRYLALARREVEAAPPPRRASAPVRDSAGPAGPAGPP